MEEKRLTRAGWQYGAMILGVALACAAMANADDAYWSGDIGGMGPAYAVEVVHEDADPFKGTFSIQVTNTGSEPWGDFHFEIFDPMGWQDISNVHFLDSTTDPPGPDPTSSQSPLTWLIDNDVVGATCDLFFYTDPVWPGETATFAVYTNNPDQLPFFGIMLYPTPVPEPTAVALLGAAVLLLRRRV